MFSVMEVTGKEAGSTQKGGSRDDPGGGKTSQGNQGEHALQEHRSMRLMSWMRRRMWCSQIIART